MLVGNLSFGSLVLVVCYRLIDSRGIGSGTWENANECEDIIAIIFYERKLWFPFLRIMVQLSWSYCWDTIQSSYKKTRLHRIYSIIELSSILCWIVWLFHTESISKSFLISISSQRWWYSTDCAKIKLLSLKKNSRFGTVGETNVQGEEVKKLDVLANELFINMLKSSYTVALLISEENETVIEVIKKYCILSYYKILSQGNNKWNINRSIQKEEANTS